MTSSPRRLRAVLGLVATLSLVLGGAAGATAETSDRDGGTRGGAVTTAPAGDIPHVTSDAQISEIIAEPWVYAHQRTTVSVVVSGTVPPGAYVAFDVFEGPGGAVCDPADAIGVASAPAVVGPVWDPEGWAPRQVGPFGWNAVLYAADDTVLDTASCAVIESRAFFTDVPGDHPFFGPIQDLGVFGVAEGYQPGPQFRPGQAQSRQAMAAFLQRYLMKGDPAPACTTSPFLDVPVDHPFCGAIAWLKAEGIVDGYEDGTFRPAAPVTRQAGAAIIARALGAPGDASCDAGLFSDLPADHPFCGAIAWLAGETEVRGYDDGTFRPGSSMTRQAMATWMVSSFPE